MTYAFCNRIRSWFRGWRHIHVYSPGTNIEIYSVRGDLKIDVKIKGPVLSVFWEGLNMNNDVVTMELDSVEGECSHRFEYNRTEKNIRNQMLFILKTIQPHHKEFLQHFLATRLDLSKSSIFINDLKRRLYGRAGSDRKDIVPQASVSHC